MAVRTLIALEPQHPRKRLRHPFIVVDDEDGGRRALGHQRQATETL